MGQIAFKKLPDAPGTRTVTFGAPRVIAREIGSLQQAAPPANAETTLASDAPAPARRSRAAELYREHGAVVYRRCLKLLRNTEAARDATQEVFARLVQHLDRLDDRETILPWMFRVATNHCLNHLRDQRRRAEEGGDDALEVGAPSSANVSPNRALANAVLSRFDEGTQAIAVGVLVDEMDHEELAQALGVSRRTVARKLERFLRNARRIFDDKPARRGAARVSPSP